MTAFAQLRSHPDVLRKALDPDRMSRRLAPFMKDVAASRVVAARVVGPESGERVVIAYQAVAGHQPAWFGKVYSDPQRAERLMDLLVQLHALDAGVPLPLAHLPDFGMAVFATVPGRTLDCLGEPERQSGMFAAGRWLARLHSCELVLDRRLDLPMEVHNAGEWAQLVVDFNPRSAPALAQLLERIRSLATQVEPLALVPIHKDFQYQHALFDGGRVAVIDLDEMRAGDPAFDVAHFEANLSLLAVRGGMTRRDLARLEAAFMQGYRSGIDYEPDARHQLFHAYTCIKIAKQLVRGRGPGPAPTGQEQVRQIQLILAEGLKRSQL